MLRESLRVLVTEKVSVRAGAETRITLPVSRFVATSVAAR